ncbi:hypothetical protein IEU95_09300 [Hoyosella rhizosphaerae]|uniref:hypothetical protein n=1 Tax=Hoyosella rhizosphaerae TaxID=1755582 RepID=UPI001664095A|nr:hypothetical protein [Hoyosella rhizosphaerae]MBN4927028.1 hypothetical protein [Hoyosella rhizosphaerae]
MAVTKEKSTQLTSPCESCVACAQRLSVDFNVDFSPRVIARVLSGCISDLAGTPRDDLPELSERLARYRLEDAQKNHSVGTSWVRADDGLCPVITRVNDELSACALRRR